jgi:hypothetical protein
VRQFGAVGELWIPVHLSCQAISIWLAGGNPFNKADNVLSAEYNPLEKGPEQGVPWPVFPRVAW